VPALADFNVLVKNALVDGSLSGDVQFTLGIPFEASRGNVVLRASNLRLGDAPVGGFEIDADLADGAVTAKKFAARLTGDTTIDANGRVALAAPHAYSGKLDLVAPDLSAFAPVLETLGEHKRVAGSVVLNLDGEGDFSRPGGNVRLVAKDVRYDTTAIDEARLLAQFTPQTFETTELSVVMNKLRAGARVVWKDRRLTLSDLDARLDGLPMVTGSLSVPFDPTGASPLPPNEPITANLVARELDVARLLASLGQHVSAAGTVSAALEAGGTLAQPTAKLEVKGSKLRGTTLPANPERSKIKQPQPLGTSTREESLPPTDVEARVTLEGSKLELAGTARQPLIQPLTFSASTTLDVKPLLEGKALNVDALPLKASVDLPASSLAFLPRQTPVIARIDGTGALSVRATGTFGKPTFEGSTTLDIKLARFSDGAIPLITNFKGRVSFAGDRASIGEFAGEAGGGKFALTGSVGFAKLSEPVFDLAFRSRDVLVLRDDTILVRAETDLALRGPLPAAAATGTVFITQSRFNKEIEILPLSLPGRPKPTPKVVAQPKRISFPEPPLRDWTFDIAIKTRTDDPFLVRGNLARGKAMLDVRLAGNGLNPYLTGAATVEQFSATLPLSTMTTRRGLVTFSQEAPFEPYLDLEAESRIRQYTVVAYVSGPASKPQVVLESEPPLPQSEIMSLLTTGSLTGEVGANNTALATRAGILVIKSWYKKVFKRDFPLGAEDTGGESILDRFQVDIGAVDQKTGRNEATAQIRLTDRFFFIGDVEMGGGISGRVKYLLRFR
jgi:autotransporter translocation and assembly factor TamB